jgi:hypothetical protein
MREDTAQAAQLGGVGAADVVLAAEAVDGRRIETVLAQRILLPEDRMNRIAVSVSFSSDSQGMVVGTDLGFGVFRESGGELFARKFQLVDGHILMEEE